jgi:N-acetyl-anhydromuramyl-L-alanine amidase AmpD
MARLLWLADVLRDAGLRVVGYKGWETRGSPTMAERPSLLMQHHTAGVGRGVLDLLANGRSDLAGPLCHVCPRPNGEMVVIASGKANHAGKGSWQPADGPLITSSTQCIGFENEHQGTSAYPWPPAQLEAIEIGTAAILHHIGRSHERSVLHKEWAKPPGRKPDPVGWSGPKHRERLRLRMNPIPAYEEKTDMDPYLAQAEGTPVYLIFPNGQAEAGVPTEEALNDCRRVYGDKIEPVSKDFLRLHGVSVD